MRKKISAKDLSVGMYVHGMDMPWIKTPFFRHRFLVTRERQVEKIRESEIKYVYIDTEKGRDVAPDRDEENAMAVERLISEAAEGGSAARALALKQEHDEPGHYIAVELDRKELSRYSARKDELFQINKQTLVEGLHPEFEIYFKRGVDIRAFYEVYDMSGGIGSDILDVRGDLLIEEKDVAVYREYLKEAAKHEAPDASVWRMRNDIIRENAKLAVKELLSDPRSGKSIEACKGIVEEIIGSIQESGGLVASLLTINNFDYYTYTHSVDVCVLAVGVAMAMGMNRERDLAPLGLGCLMHDVGKSAIPHEILNKPTLLTPKEYDVMKRHVLEGYEIIKTQEGISSEALYPLLEHHERVDGSGYPKGLDGGRMHLSGKIASLADTYDALTTRRVYQQAHTPFEALVAIRWVRETFDQEVFGELVKMLARNVEHQGEAPGTGL